jgi:hypothetical protein
MKNASQLHPKAYKCEHSKFAKCLGNNEEHRLAEGMDAAITNFCNLVDKNYDERNHAQYADDLYEVSDLLAFVYQLFTFTQKVPAD